MTRQEPAKKSQSVASKIRLDGGMVVLREKRLGDAARDYAWRTDLELSRLDAVSPLTMLFPQYLLNYAEELRCQEPGRHFAIEAAAGKHIGNCMYYTVDRDRGETELGILIGDRNYWGQGYGQDAVTTLVNHIFATTRLNRIYLHTLRDNIRAQRCFGKCGFVECGHLLRDGHDFVILELWRSRWQKARAIARS